MSTPAIRRFFLSAGAIRQGLFVCVLALLPWPIQAADTVVYYHNDALGSPIAATDAQGQLLWREEYQPYGERILKQGDAQNALWYTGKPEEKDLGISYFGARWYDPSIGRFMAVDPVSFQEGNIHSFNTYNYANNNPYKFVDPDGNNPGEPWAPQFPQDLSLVMLIGALWTDLTNFVKGVYAFGGVEVEAEGLQTEQLGLVGYNRENGWWLGDLGAAGGHIGAGKVNVGQETIYYPRDDRIEKENLLLAETQYSGKKCFVSPKIGISPEIGIGGWINPNHPDKVGGYVYIGPSVGPFSAFAGIGSEAHLKFPETKTYLDMVGL